MQKLSTYLTNQIKKDQKKNFTNKQLHKLFDNENIDQNQTMIDIIDKYFPNGGMVGYECQDEIDHNVQFGSKIETQMIRVPNTNDENNELTYEIDIYQCENCGKKVYLCHIFNELTSINIYGNKLKEEDNMLSLKESLELDRQIEEGKTTELEKYLEECIKESIETGKPFDDCIDEGLFTGLLGGLAGATVGSSIMKSFCKVLGIDEKGVLGGLLTSRTVLAAMGANLGYRI